MVRGVDVLVSSAGGTGVSIAIHDAQDEPVFATSAELPYPVSLPIGYRISFGPFTAAPSVLVGGS
jgi:hypothetical protein